MRLKAMQSGHFLMKLAAAAAMVAAGDVLFWQKAAGGGFFGIYGLILLVGAAAFRPAIRSDWRALSCMAMAGGGALAMVFDPGLLAWSLYWVFAGMTALMPATARFDDAWRWAQRLLLHALRSTVAPLLDARRVLRIRRQRSRLKLRGLLPNLVLPLAGSVIILVLFAAANPVIDQALNSLGDVSWLAPAPFRITLWLACFAGGWSLLRPRLPRCLLGTFDGAGDLPLPGVTMASVRISLLAFNSLFALQNAMDLAWLWGMMPLPKGITLADYAHRGAYPLIVTALLAAVFVLVALRPGSKTAAEPAIRRLVVLWVAQNILLVANAALRTLDYIAAYSLTALRIAALLWMGLVALGLVLICWRLLQSKSSAWLINANAAAAMALLMGCGFVDLDAAAATYNVRHAREVGGKGASIDMCYLQVIGSSALVPLAELEQRPAPEAIHLMARLLRENAQLNLTRDMSSGRWSLLGEWRLADVKLRLRQAAMAPQYRDPHNCAAPQFGPLRLTMGLDKPAPQPQPPNPARPALTPTPPQGQ